MFLNKRWLKPRGTMPIRRRHRVGDFRRESALLTKRAELAKAVELIEQQFTARLESERERIAAEEAEKARLLWATGLESKSREVADYSASSKSATTSSPRLEPLKLSLAARTCACEPEHSGLDAPSHEGSGRCAKAGGIQERRTDCLCRVVPRGLSPAVTRRFRL